MDQKFIVNQVVTLDHFLAGGGLTISTWITIGLYVVQVLKHELEYGIQQKVISKSWFLSRKIFQDSSLITYWRVILLQDRTTLMKKETSELPQQRKTVMCMWCTHAGTCVKAGINFYLREREIFLVH